MTSFLAIAIPIIAIVVLALVLRRDGAGRGPSSVPRLPKSELSRQVWKATRPARAARRASAPVPASRPKFAPPTPPGTVASFRPPRQRDRRGA